MEIAIGMPRCHDRFIILEMIKLDFNLTILIARLMVNLERMAQVSLKFPMHTIIHAIISGYITS